MVSLGILNLMLPIIVQIHTCLSPINRISTSQRNGNSPIDDKCEKKKKRREIDLGNEILLNFPQKSFTKNRERNLYIFLLDPSGLTGLEPAASALTGRCSDQLNYNPREIKCTIYICLWFYFLQTLSMWIHVDFRFELSYCNSDTSNILIYARTSTLVKGARITSNFLLLPNWLIINL